MSLAGLLLLASGVSAQTMTGSIFCICPGGKRGHIQAPNSCESFCGGSEQRGFTAPQHDAQGQRRRDQEAVERARLLREEEERRARAERAAQERQFESNKREALSQLKGVTIAEPQLRGVGGNSSGLRGLREPDAPKRPEKSCRIVDSCRAALETQRAALESARTGQADLYSAAGAADLEHGLDKAQEALKESGTAGRVAVYAWKSKDRLGLPKYEQDYKEVVDEASELVDEDTLAEASQGAAGRVKALRKKAESLDAFARYMKTLLTCAKGRDADFNRCAKNSADNFGKALDGLPLADETVARVKAAANAFERYSTGALKKALDAAGAASKCLETCR